MYLVLVEPMTSSIHIAHRNACDVIKGEAEKDDDKEEEEKEKDGNLAGDAR